MRLKGRKLYVLKISVLGFLSRVVAAGSNSSVSSGYKDAVRTAVSPGSYDEGMFLMQILGKPLAVIMIAPLLLYILLGAFFEYWDDRKYWIILVAMILVDLIMLVMLPKLLVAA